jgi:multicomponent K+:H+ antiporter subunit E
MRGFSLAIALAITYAGVLGSVHPFDLACAAVIGLALSARGRHPSLEGRLRTWRHLVAGPRLALGFTSEILRGAYTMLLVLMGRRPWEHLGLLEIELADASPEGTATAGLLMTASPGSVVLNAELETGRVLLHVIDISRPEERRRDLERFYEEYQRRAIP